MSAAENLGYIPGLQPDLGQAPLYGSLPQFPHLQDGDDDTGLTSKGLHNLLTASLYLWW